MLTRSLLIAILFGLISGCAPASKVVDDTAIKRVWPPAPEQPRIAFEQAFSNAEQLGIGKGFWQWLFDVFTGAEDVQMVRPMAVVTSRQGVIYVADPGAKGVHRFDPANHRYDLLRRKNDQPLPSPVSLAIDAQDDVYLADSELARLFKISPGDEYATAFELDEKLAQPTGLAINRNNNQLAVVDTARHQVFLFDKQGRLLKNFGQRGEANGEFNYPTMIWCQQNGNMLVTDSLNFRIQVFDKNGHFLSKFGQLGDGTGYHARPKGVATDNAGHVYVVDSLFHNVQMFDASGRFLMNIGEQGNAEGQFWLPTGIFIDRAEKIYVADSYNRRVQLFRYIGNDL